MQFRCPSQALPRNLVVTLRRYAPGACRIRPVDHEIAVRPGQHRSFIFAKLAAVPEKLYRVFSDFSRNPDFTRMSVDVGGQVLEPRVLESGGDSPVRRLDALVLQLKAYLQELSQRVHRQVARSDFLADLSGLLR